MTKLSLIILVFLSVCTAFGDEGFMNFGNTEFSKTKTLESKWVFKLGTESMRYQLTLPEFEGEDDSFQEKSFEDIIGMGLGFGRDFYLGAGFSFNLGLGLTYINTLNQDKGGAEDLEIEVSSTRKKLLYTSGEVTAAISYIFDNKYVDIQPFIEGSAGIGRTEINYKYQRLPIGGDINSELYNVDSLEEFSLAKVGIGLNLIGYRGLISYLKVTTAKVFFNKRTISGESNLYGTNDVISYDTSGKESEVDDEATVTMASLGIGYMF